MFTACLTLHTLYCTKHTANCTLEIGRCTLNTWYCTLLTALHCTGGTPLRLLKIFSQRKIPLSTPVLGTYRYCLQSSTALQLCQLYSQIQLYSSVNCTVKYSCTPVSTVQSSTSVHLCQLYSWLHCTYVCTVQSGFLYSCLHCKVKYTVQLCLLCVLHNTYTIVVQT